MEEIKCTSYEKREFIRLLKYAKEMKQKQKVKQLEINIYYDSDFFSIIRISLPFHIGHRAINATVLDSMAQTGYI